MADFLRENKEPMVKYASAFSFAEHWVMTTAKNIYDTTTDKFADEILYYPALGGNMENPVFSSVAATRVFMNPTMVSASEATSYHPYNIAFLELDKNAAMPDCYFGFRYQYTSYEGEFVSIIGYPNDLPADADEQRKGTYLYRGLGKISLTETSFLYHKADTSEGEEGAPMAVCWDHNGWVTIGLNVFEETGRNVGIRFNRLIYGAMKMIRNNGMEIVPYVQPDKPDNTDLANISSLFNDFKTLGEMYVSYCKYADINPVTLRSEVVGICNYLRHLGYDGIVWATALLDPIDSEFVKRVQEINPELHNRLLLYIAEKGRKNLRDSGNGVIDLAHFAATLEGQAGFTLAPDFWTGWGADLATGMDDTTKTIADTLASNIEITNALITQTANYVIGNEKYRCNFSDFCCDFDAIKIAQIVDENNDKLSSEEVNGHEFGEIMEQYYTKLYQNRFAYVYSDLDCSIATDLETLYNVVYTKMTGIEERAGLLTLYGKIPEEQVIRACCYSFAQYIKSEI